MLAADVPVQHAPAHAAASRVETAIVRALNRTRSRYGLPRLHQSRTLFTLAGEHSRDMAVHGTLSHDSSDGTSFGDRLRRVTRARLMGETLVELSGAAGARRVVGAWMNSPGHREAILTGGYHRVGVGSVRRGRWFFVTADFTS